MLWVLLTDVMSTFESVTKESIIFQDVSALNLTNLEWLTKTMNKSLSPQDKRCKLDLFMLTVLALPAMWLY